MGRQILHFGIAFISLQKLVKIRNAGSVQWQSNRYISSMPRNEGGLDLVIRHAESYSSMGSPQQLADECLLSLAAYHTTTTIQ
jgi:hypothetical protein